MAMRCRCSPMGTSPLMTCCRRWCSSGCSPASRRAGTPGAEPVGKALAEAATATGRSAVSRRFVKETETALAELLARDLSGKDIKVLMLDGEHMAGRCVIVALAITAGAEKFPVGLWDGATENKTVVKAMLADLVCRGLSAEDGLLVVMDGAKALSAAVNEVFGCLAAVQRCTLHYAEWLVMPSWRPDPLRGTDFVLKDSA